MKFTEKQKEYIRNCNEKTYNIKEGATRSGKSYLDVSYIIMKRIVSLIGKDGLILILGVTKGTIETNILTPLRNIYGKENVGEIRNDNKVKLFGEWCYCIGCSNKKAVSIIRGKSCKYIYGDEIADWAPEVWDIIPSRLDHEYSVFEGSLNPKNKKHWFKTWMEKNKENVYRQKYQLDDNTFLNEKVRERIKNDYKGTIYYDRYVLGEWVDAEGIIYRIFADNPLKYKLTVEETKEKLKDLFTVNIGLDFGGNGSNHALCCTAITKKGELISLKSLTFPANQKDVFDVIETTEKFVKEVEELYNIKVSVIYADNAEPTIINTMKKKLKTIVRGCDKDSINERIKTTLLLMSRMMFYYTEYENSSQDYNLNYDLKEALEDAVYNSKAQNDERLDDGTSNIDQLDSFEYTFTKYIKFLQNIIK